MRITTLEGSILPSSGGSQNISDSVAFSVTGSGFGTKSTSAPVVYDNAQGTNMLQGQGGLWSWVWHGTQHEPAGDGWAEAYHLPSDIAPDSTAWGQTGANFVGPATPLRSKFIAGAAATTTGSGYNAGSIAFGLTQSSLAPPYYLICSWYEAFSPNWVFNAPYSGSGETAPGDNNFKWIVYTTSLVGGFSGKYFYVEMQNSRFTGPTTNPKTDINDDGSGIVGRGSHSPGYAIPGPAMPNKFYNGCNGWVKKELAMYMTAATNGFIKITMSVPGTNKQPRFQTYNWDSTVGTGTTDPYGGTGRTFWMGGFRRDFPQTLNRQYWSDIYLDIQTTGLGRFALTDTNSLSTATVIEYQPYTAWSNNSVTLTCSKGNLASGTVYLWYLDEVNGNQFIGPYTMN